jgi:hypothetical protein
MPIRRKAGWASEEENYSNAFAIIISNIEEHYSILKKFDDVQRSENLQIQKKHDF